MDKQKKVRILYSILQLAILIALAFIVPKSDGILILFGLGFVILAYFLKLRYSGWAVVSAYPIAFVFASLLDTPHPINGSLPNNLYPLWYMIYIGSCIAFFVLELLMRFKKETADLN